VLSILSILYTKIAEVGTMSIGLLRYVTALRHSSRNSWELRPHAFGPEKGGALVLESSWGARKWDRGKIILSAGVYHAMHSHGEDLMDFLSEEGLLVIITPPPEGKRWPKMIFPKPGEKSIAFMYLLIEASGGFRGHCYLERGQSILTVKASAAWGGSGWFLVPLRPKDYIIIEHTGRLYGAGSYTVFYCPEIPRIIKSEIDSLEELEE